MRIVLTPNPLASTRRLRGSASSSPSKHLDGGVSMTRPSVAILALMLLSAARNPSTGPPTDPLTVTTSDPAGDTSGSLAVQWDLTALALPRVPGGIDFAIDLPSNALSPLSGDSDSVYGEIDFDTDQSA